MAVSDVNQRISVSISLQQSQRQVFTPQSKPAQTNTQLPTFSDQSDAVQILFSAEIKTPQQGPGAAVGFGGPRSGGGLPRLERQKRNFDNIDSNSDGSLSLDELKSAQSTRQAAGRNTPFIDRLINNFDQADADQSGGVSFAEAHPREAAFVQKLFGFQTGSQNTGVPGTEESKPDAAAELKKEPAPTEKSQTVNIEA